MSTIQVNLKRNWFDPDKQRRRKEHNPHELPAAWLDKLPSDAVVVKDDTPKPEKEIKKSFWQPGALNQPDNPSAVAKDAARAAKSAGDASVSVAAVVESSIAAKNTKKK